MCSKRFKSTATLAHMGRKVYKLLSVSRKTRNQEIHAEKASSTATFSGCSSFAVRVLLRLNASFLVFASIPPPNLMERLDSLSIKATASFCDDEAKSMVFSIVWSRDVNLNFFEAQIQRFPGGSPAKQSWLPVFASVGTRGSQRILRAYLGRPSGGAGQHRNKYQNPGGRASIGKCRDSKCSQDRTTWYGERVLCKTFGESRNYQCRVFLDASRSLREWQIMPGCWSKV